MYVECAFTCSPLIHGCGDRIALRISQGPALSDQDVNPLSNPLPSVEGRVLGYQECP